jgi:hypothetical protein
LVLKLLLGLLEFSDLAFECLILQQYLIILPSAFDLQFIGLDELLLAPFQFLLEPGDLFAESAKLTLSRLVPFLESLGLERLISELRL